MAGSAGLDLYSAENGIVPARGRVLISTGLQLGIPRGYYGRIAPRSGLAFWQSLDVGGGVIDPDYRGIVYVLLLNFSLTDIYIKRGQKIAQLILERFGDPTIWLVPRLESTQRGSGSFGSTDEVAEKTLPSNETSAKKCSFS